jgi:predicted nuclease of restriction endonuclease-like (RecB) superfamily
MSSIDSDDYRNLLVEVKQRIRSAQYAALRTVNQELIALYWDIGQLIVTQQQGETWGKSVVEQLAKDHAPNLPILPTDGVKPS